MINKPTYEELENKIKFLKNELDRHNTTDLNKVDLENEISFHDLFDINEIQKIQDLFAEATGVASIITNPNGFPITKPSNFCRLCIDIIRKTEKGLKNCYHSDAEIGKQNISGAIYQPCLSGGLWDGGASISVGGKHIANWLIGQVKNENIDEHKMLIYAKEIGADEIEFKKALDEVSIMSSEKFKKIADTLFYFANELSQKAYHNIIQNQLIAELQTKEEQLIRAKEKAEENETIYRKMNENSPLGMHFYKLENNQLIFTGYNPAADRLLKVDNSQFVGKTIEIAFPPLAQTEVPYRYREAAEKGISWITEQINYEDKMIVGAFEVRAFQTTPSNMVAIFDDITERKQAELNLQQKNEEIEAQNEEYLQINEELNQANQKLLQAKQIIEESEEKFRLMIKNSNDTFVLINAEGEQFYISDAAIRDTGYSIEELKGPIQNVIYPDDLEIVLKAWNDILTKKDEIIRVQYRHKHKYKEYIWYEAAAQNFLDNHAINAVVVNVRDITKIKETEIELRNAKEKAEESEVRFRNSIYYSPIPTAIAKNDGELIFLNQQFVKTYGYTLNDIPFIEKWFELAHPDLQYRNFVLNDWNKEIKYSIKNNVPTDIKEYQVTCKNGEIKTVAISTYFEKDIYIGLFQDITEKKKAEIELIKAKEKAEESENFLIAIIENQPGLIWLKDKEGQFQKVNSKFLNSCGLNNPEQLYGKTDFDIWPKELAKKYTDDDTNVINSKKSIIVEELIFYNGINKWFETFKTPIINDHGNILGTTGYSVEITERKRVEFELIKAKEKAEESDKLKTAFLQNMSHEIRTPMNAIIGFSDFLDNPDLSIEKRKSFTSIIQNSTKQLLSIITDILSISSIETNQAKVCIDKVCINNIIVDLLAIFKSQAQTHNISLYTKQQLTDKQSEIYTDKTKVTQILTNLITNALKFTHEGFIEIGYNLKNDFLEFYVKDSGIGIKDDVQDKIFERFRQAHENIAKKYGGTGLGLAISKAFVELLDGKIWVQSELEKGSTFYFTIPYKPVFDMDKTNSQTMQTETKITILVAEDEEYNFLYLEELLNSSDIKLIHTKDGKETLEVSRQNSDIDLILMDIKMPIMTGHDAAKYIKEFRPDLPIIAQSAYALEHELEKYSGTAFDDYITKPINKDKLKQVLTKYIDKQINKWF